MYPATSFYFSAVIDADIYASHTAFTQVSGLDVEREVEEIKEGGENRFVHRVPGRLKHGNLVLKRGMVDVVDPLYLWCKTALEGDLDRPIVPRNVMVILFQADQTPLVVWNCASAWPVKWSIAAFDAMQGQVAMETLELSYTTLTRTVPL